ncbi:MAG: DNA polymerase III subunit delta [Oscillatoriales cyanobacterium RM1_1_9]|nr:DNA polymerase III subunit delta [Oscillatoriales cyanobacterium SM2_3_0]NJO45813.1 DNA polymerase III subunit delta [Oscillatoriales cyanobacterium RM2_1_1]NJO70846.1 DNA polymerase III subunit delta [Oscillatoriales cyanobacterium RM1_1_9]
MPIYLYWGDDDFLIARAVTELHQSSLDPSWVSFNFDKILPDQSDGITFGLNQAMTPPFGAGNRLIWLVNTPLVQRCSEETLAELKRTLTHLPPTTILLLTSVSKPDNRLKSTKLIQAHGTLREFSRASPWKTDQLLQQVRQVARIIDVPLTPKAMEFLVEAVGNDTRQLYNELEKLKLYSLSQSQPLDERAIAPLVQTTTQTSLKLAGAIKSGNSAQALEILRDLLNQNEPALRIVATLVNQLRLWLWIKLLIEQGVRDEREMAKAAEVGNPNRIYFLRQEVKFLSLEKLQQALPLLLDLETQLKRGAEAQLALQTKLIELCRLFKSA